MSRELAVASFRGRWPAPVYFAYRAMRLVLICSAFAGFWGGAVLLAWLVLPIVAIVARRPHHACQRIVRWTWKVFHGYMRTLRLFDACVVGGTPALDRPVVLVANHTTLVDVTAVSSEIPDVCCVAKPVYMRSPFVGRLIALAGFIDAGATVQERGTMIERARERLDDGFHVLVFPEGSRSPEGRMNRFQRGAFEIACRANVPVVPVVLRCRPSALRKDQRVWQQPDGLARLTLEVDGPFEPADFGFSSRKMRDAVEAHYRARLGLLDSAREGPLIQGAG